MIVSGLYGTLIMFMRNYKNKLALGIFLLVASGTSYAHTKMQKEILYQKGESIILFEKEFEARLDGIYNNSVYPTIQRAKERALDDLFIQTKLNEYDAISVVQVGIKLNEEPDIEVRKVVPPRVTRIHKGYVWDIYEQGADQHGNHFRMWAGFKSGESMKVVTEELPYDPNSPEALDMLTKKQKENLKFHRLREARSQEFLNDQRPKSNNDPMSIKDFQEFQSKVNAELDTLKADQKSKMEKVERNSFYTMIASLLGGLGGFGLLILGLLDRFIQVRRISAAGQLYDEPEVVATTNDASKSQDAVKDNPVKV